MRIMVQSSAQGVGSTSCGWDTPGESNEEAASSSSSSRTSVKHAFDVPPGVAGFNFEMVKVEIKEEDGSVSEDMSTSSDGENDGHSEAKKKTVPKGTKYNCLQCGKSFCYKYSLRRHEWSHSKKTLSCKHCGKIFTNQESYLRHERMHQSGNRYQCPMCDKSYMSRTSHAAHVRKHTGERPYKCPDCEETFYLVSSFERHVAKHRGVKDYKCEICNAGFWVADDLRAHVNRKH